MTLRVRYFLCCLCEVFLLNVLLAYKIEHRTPSHINYRGYKIHSTVAPSSGAVALSALNTLSGYDLDYVTVNGSKRDSNLTTHRMVEAMKVIVHLHPPACVSLIV